MTRQELKHSWEDNRKTGQAVRVNLNSGEKFTADDYRMLKTSVLFLLDGAIVTQTPTTNVWYFT